MFTMHPIWERFFFVFTFLMQGSSFLSPRTYALLHRMHHACSELDPHSPHHSGNAFTMMWKTKTVYQDVLQRRSEAAKRFEDNVYPEWVALENFAHRWYARLGWGMLYTSFYVVFATAWLQYLLLFA